jgi:signal transduction histidine kinase
LKERFGQVVNNLARNALDAMGNGGGCLLNKIGTAAQKEFD